MASPANESIRYRLAVEPESKWGFIVYRCTYDSDEEWGRYMSILNKHVRAMLEPEGLSDCFDRIDWNVQKDPRYEGMDDEGVRAEFKNCVESGEEVNDGSARSLARIWVDEMSMKFITEEDHPPEKSDMFGMFHVYLVSVEEAEIPGDGVQAVGLSYLLPRAYLLIEDPGWCIIYKENGDVSLP